MKTPEERGPFATWALEAADALDLTPEQIAAELGYDGASIRKMEAGPKVSRPMRLKVTALLQRVAKARGMRLPPPPGEVEPVAQSTGDNAALIAALERQAAVMEALVAEMREDRAIREGEEEAIGAALGKIEGTLRGLALVPVGRSRRSNG